MNPDSTTGIGAQGSPDNPQVLQILTRLGAGGPPMAVTFLARELNRLGFRTQLITGRCDHVDLDMSYLLNADDSVVWVPEMSRSVSLRNDLIALWRLYRLIRAARPTIVQTHTAKAGALGRIAARLAGVPIVIHTYHGHVMSGYFPEHVSFAIRVVERMLARITDAIVVLADQQKFDLVDRFRIASKHKVTVAPLGLDLQPFHDLPLPDRSGGFLTVGWLGRFVEVKNLPLLIQVMEETFRVNNRIRFLVAGDGTQRQLLEDATRRWGPERLEWLGWVRNVEQVISRCDVLIQTSRNEGTPVALIQGMAAGRPFVSTRAGGVVDMVQKPAVREGVGAQWFSNAVLVDPDPQAFVDVLCELEGNCELLTAMGQQAATFAAAGYSLELLARNYVELYRKLSSRAGLADELETVPSKLDGVYSAPGK